MRRTKQRVIALVLVLGAASVPVATTEARTDPPSTTCGEWATAMKAYLAPYGIEGRQADSYLAQRADNPCHARITPRSAFHAGDPG
jgi:hypothetical protein